MLGFLAGVATGYVLGARAGRERYDQILRSYRRVADHPTVRNTVGTARAKATEAVTGHSQEDQHQRSLREA